ncbi:hypothetical protein [Sporosarcina sp. ZBG7A]|uniref:hypothetical protein n=1 Tax=Sporosarcina sp. ZBG7A TaxID=1582223 RepID=UPI000A84EA77|nr:hypothetical protein [Sporosarcina sp. ZBG7A]
MDELIGIEAQFNCFKGLFGSASLLLVGLCTLALGIGNMEWIIGIIERSIGKFTA